LIEGCANFDVHQMGVGEFGNRMLSPAAIFTAELSALFTALRHTAEVIRPPERSLILNEFDQDYTPKKLRLKTNPIKIKNETIPN
jgi:hypothetical protein